MDRQLFYDHQYKHEYAILVGRRFDLLLPEQRNEWFKWIDAGPDMSNFDASIRDHLGRDATNDDRDGHIAYWKFEKLHWVRAHLDGERRQFYERMLAEHGETASGGTLMSSTSAGRWGHESSMSVDELSQMNFEQAVDVVSSWKADQSRFDGPSIEGLPRRLANTWQRRPEEFSQQALTLVNRPAIFVRTFIKQMSDAINAGRVLDLPAVIKLCEWVATTLDFRTQHSHAGGRRVGRQKLAMDSGRDHKVH